MTVHCCSDTPIPFLVVEVVVAVVRVVSVPAYSSAKFVCPTHTDGSTTTANGQGASATVALCTATSHAVMPTFVHEVSAVELAAAVAAYTTGSVAHFKNTVR